MPKKLESKVVERESDEKYASRKLEEYCHRLRDDVKQKLDASIRPLEGSYEDRQLAFTARLDQWAQQDGRKGTRWMPLPEIYRNVREYGQDVIVEAVVSGRVEFGVA
ncbi:MAG: hypothetical protein NTY06_03110 [Candidatus Gottesmanbacteria bacterium]|nr:hypothetical protein [Candidatus Gottesmanbacteria bacterium]